MQLVTRALVGILLGLASLGFAQDAGAGSHLPSQAAADIIREFAGTDGAFLAAGLVKESSQRDNLASLVQFPTETIVVVNLTGAQIKQAFERSVSLYPQKNTDFLQISGFEASFKKSAAAGQRIVSISANGTKLDERRTYTVAMPASLGRGGLGYFKIWDTSKIAKTLESATVESVLRGKRFSETSPRWSVLD